MEPRIVSTHPIGCLVSCRLEKYRSLTEEWLKKNRIQYNQLFMMLTRPRKREFVQIIMDNAKL